MPGQLFNDAERKQLGGYPPQVSQEDLVTFYTLTKADKAQVNRCTDDAGRLGFALQLGTLRHLGFCPDDLASAPPEVVGSCLVFGSALGPAAAGFLVGPLGYRGLFAALAAVGAIATAIVVVFVPETLVRHDEVGEGHVIVSMATASDLSTIP